MHHRLRDGRPHRLHRSQQRSLIADEAELIPPRLTFFLPLGASLRPPVLIPPSFYYALGEKKGHVVIFAITSNQSVMNINRGQMLLDSVETVEIRQSIWGRILGYAPS